MVPLELLDSLFACQTVQEWHFILAALAGKAGFPQFFFGLVKDRNASFENAFIRSNYSQAWREKYDEERLHFIDPIVSHCAQHLVPLIWKNGTFTGERQSAFYEQACQYGLRSGVSFPMHGLSGEFGILSFVDSADNAGIDATRLSALALIRDYAFESSLKFLAEHNQIFKPRVKLTRRELDCLKWVMHGKTSWETAQIIKCSEPTVNFHIANVNKKLNVRSRQHAILKAIKLRLIVPH